MQSWPCRRFASQDKGREKRFKHLRSGRTCADVSCRPPKSTELRRRGSNPSKVKQLRGVLTRFRPSVRRPAAPLSAVRCISIVAGAYGLQKRLLGLGQARLRLRVTSKKSLQNHRTKLRTSLVREFGECHQGAGCVGHQTCRSFLAFLIHFGLISAAEARRWSSKCQSKEIRSCTSGPSWPQESRAIQWPHAQL